MLSSFLQREKKQLLDGVRPGTPHTDSIRRAIEGAFEVADTAASHRQGIAYDHSYTAAQRKSEMASLVDDRLFPQLASVTAPARKAKSYAERERTKYYGGYLPAEVAGLIDDVGRVETAVYFARRELEQSSAMNAADIQTMLTSETTP